MNEFCCFFKLYNFKRFDSRFVVLVFLEWDLGLRVEIIALSSVDSMNYSLVVVPVQNG